MKNEKVDMRDKNYLIQDENVIIEKNHVWKSCGGRKDDIYNCLEE